MGADGRSGSIVARGGFRRASAVVAVLAATLIAVLASEPPRAHAKVVWLCEPGRAPNPCEIRQDTTYQKRGGGRRVQTPAAGAREVDCFYVYPTVSNQLRANATKSRDPELLSIAKYQAARFSLNCRVFAPIYRQRTLAALQLGIAGIPSGDRELAYADVLEAWREYLAARNGGRGVVLIGHSQGTFMLRELLAREIEANPVQHRLLVSALLLGGDVTTAAGATTGGDFARTPICTRPGEVGCVVAYSSFFRDPPPGARFGVAPRGLEVACTDPRTLLGSSEPLRLLTPSEPFAPGLISVGIAVTALPGLPPWAQTTWVSPPDRSNGSCRKINGAHVLRLEPRPGSRRPTWYPEPGWGTHLIDVSIALDQLVELVGRQASQWTAEQAAQAG